MGERLLNQAAWISGGASGIGAAVARLFASEGAAVAVIDVQAREGDALVAEISAAGGRAVFYRCEVRDEDQVRQTIDKTAAAFGGLQIVVNCAGVVHVSLLHETSCEDWQRVMDVNVKSMFLAVKHAIPHLRKNARCYVVNIGSISSFIAQSGTPAYTASKGAVLMLTKSIALDYAADGLRCNCLCPGITDTPMLREHLNATADPEATLAQRVRRVPTGVALRPEEVAKAALYLSCEDSAGVTGTALVVDGGYTAAAEWQHPGRTRFMEES